VWRVEVKLHIILTPALDEGGWSASCLGYFTSRERVSITCYIGEQEDFRAGLSMALVPARNSTTVDSHLDVCFFRY
jgi:hypothetical protein